jgi:hypothetical protein
MTCGRLDHLYTAKSEGARRIRIVGKVIALIGVTIGVLGGVLLWRQPEILVIGMIALYGVGFGALVWAAGWIVQGFLSDTPRDN